MDIDIILSRTDCKTPLFANFILDKYRDFKKSDPESARKIETQVFTRSFLLNILDNGDMFVRTRLLTHVPPIFFIPVMDELSDRYENGSFSDHGEKIDAIIKANAPDLFLTILNKKFQQQVKQESVSMGLFDWHNHVGDLSMDLRREYFDKTQPFFPGSSKSLADSSWFRAAVSNQTSVALMVDRPEAVPLAKNYLECLVQAYDEDDIDYYDVCLFFRHVLTLERFMTGYQFELNLFFDLENGHMTFAPELLNHLYQDGWNGRQLFDLYNTLIQGENLSENSLVLEYLNSINEPLLTSVIRTLIQDTALMLLLASHNLHHAILAVFASIIWQFHRKDKIDPVWFSNDTVMEFITIDSQYIPCMDQIKTYLSGISPHDRVSLLCTALEKVLDEKVLDDPDRAEYGDHAIANLMELMAHFQDPAFVPGLANVFLHDFEDDDGWLIQKVIPALSSFGDAAIDCLDSKIKEIPEYRLLDVLSLIRKIGTQRAEELLIKHFDCFINSFRPDFLSTCQSLVSQKALALLDHKVGKKQKGIDELYVIVKTLLGEADEKTQRILDALSSPWESFDTTMDMLKSKTARSVLTLALECGHCGDINDYECRNIILSQHGGAPYIADELTCISCNRMCEFNIAPMGHMVVTGEVLRLTSLIDRDETESTPFTGALRVLNTSIMGKPMSLIQGIELYKKKIRKNPKKPDHYIGLGNIYKALNQNTFAEKQYKNAIEHGPFYIESYFSLAEIANGKRDFKTALRWLEKGRPYLKRPLICKDIQITAEEIMEGYIAFHSELIELTHSQVAPILPSEYMNVGKQLKKIGRNEKCPCGSGKKYKKCCM